MYPSYCTLIYESGFIFYFVIDNLKSVDNTMAVLSQIDHSVSILCHNGEFFKEFLFILVTNQSSLLKYRCTNLMEVKGKWRLKKLHRRVSLYPPCYRNVFICNGRFSLWTDTVQFVWSFRPLTSVSYVLLGDIYSSRWYIHLESRTNVSL